MSSDYAIEVEALGKCYAIYDKPSDRLKQIFARAGRQYYREFWALQDVDLRIPRGETVGIIGRNGSGKSTLLQLICGTLNPSAGRIAVRGKVAALLELGAGFNPEFTGVENVYMAAALYGLSREQIAARFEAIAAFADIGDHIHQPVKNFSSGMYVRLAFAVIAHVDADVLIIDEALAVGDAFFVQKCMRFLRGFAERGTLLFVSHDIQSVLSLCSTAVLLEGGRVVAAGSPKEVSERYLVALHQEMESNYQASAGAVPPAGHDVPTEAVEEAPVEPLPNADEPASGDSAGSAATIVDVALTDDCGRDLKVVRGGEIVCMLVTYQANSALSKPLVGFLVRDRLGQVMFGENSGALGDVSFMIERRERGIASFTFVMPSLQSGKYSVSAAIGEGTQESHMHHHWKNDALIFDCVSNRRCFGMLALDLSAVHITQDGEC